MLVSAVVMERNPRRTSNLPGGATQDQPLWPWHWARDHAGWSAGAWIAAGLAGGAGAGPTDGARRTSTSGASSRYSTGVTTRASSVDDTRPPMITHASGE